MTVREAQPQDVPAILEILGAAPEAGQWAAGDLALPARRCWVAELQGRVAGVLLAAAAVQAESEILTLAVAREARRQGVATALLRALLLGRPGTVFLEVRASNAPARRLYEKLGFVASGRRPGYYFQPPEDAIVMRLQPPRRCDNVGMAE